MREAVNQQDFCRRVYETIGMPLQILSGYQEARYIADGARCDPNLASLQTYSLIDLGGGSLEWVYYKNGTFHQALSFPLGSVRMLERFVADPTLPFSTDVLTHIATFIKTTLNKTPFAKHASSLVGMGGNFSIVRAILAKRAGKRMEVFPHRLPVEAVRALMHETRQMPLAQRQHVFQLSPQRADIFPIALLTFITLAEIAQQEYIVRSFFNLRYGLAKKLLSELPQ